MLKKIGLMCALLLFMAGISVAADQVITITVPEAKVSIALQGFLELYPNEEKDEMGDLVYTNAEWVREKIRRNLVKDIRRGLQMIADEEARVSEDNDIAQ